MIKSTSGKRPPKNPGKPIVKPTQVGRNTKLAIAHMEIECRVQAAVFTNVFVEDRAQYWERVRRSTEGLPAAEKSKVFKAAYCVLKVYHLLRDKNLRIEWWEEHKKFGSAAYKRRKYIQPGKGGKSYDTKRLLSKAKPYEQELVVLLELEYRRIRQMWDTMREAEKLLKKWKKLCLPNMRGIDMNAVGSWTLSPDELRSELGTEVLADLVEDVDK